MTSTRVKITDPIGLHARPAAKFVEKVRESGLPLRIRRPDGPLVDATSVLAILSMGVKAGEEIELVVDPVTGVDGTRLAEIAQVLIDDGASGA